MRHGAINPGMRLSGLVWACPIKWGSLFIIIYGSFVFICFSFQVMAVIGSEFIIVYFNYSAFFFFFLYFYFLVMPANYQLRNLYIKLMHNVFSIIYFSPFISLCLETNVCSLLRTMDPFHKTMTGISTQDPPYWNLPLAGLDSGLPQIALPVFWGQFRLKWWTSSFPSTREILECGHGA